MNKLFNFKKVIFGFLIAFILFNVRKCGVYALESVNYYFWGGNSSDNINSSNTLNFCTTTSSKSCYKEVGSLVYDNSTIYFYYQNKFASSKNINTLSFIIEYNSEFYLFATYYNKNPDFDYTQGSYLDIPKGSNNLSAYPPNLNLYDNNDTLLGNFATSSTLNIGAIGSASYGFQYGIYKVDFSSIDNSVNVLIPIKDSSIITEVLNNGSLVSKNFDYKLKFNGKEFELNSSPIPSNFVELDLTNYQGVYFYPKNYNDILIETIDNKNYYDFNFYYQGCVNYGYFPLNNPQNVTLLDNSLTCSLNDISYVDSYFPTYVYEDMSFDYLYYSYLIYNTNTNSSQLGSGVGAISPSLYGNTKVYYNSDLYNYYLVEDFSTMNNKNCFINYDNQQQCIDGVGVPPFNDILDDSQNTSSDSKLDIFKYQGNNYVLQILTLPFNFLKSFSTTSCQPITLPIPFLSSNITINCLSSRFKEVLGTFGYTFITTIINGFLVYRITIRNIDTFTDVADPENDKLEAIDL